MSSNKARGEIYRNLETGLELHDEEGTDPSCPKCKKPDLLRFSHVSSGEHNTPPGPGPSAYAYCFRCCKRYDLTPRRGGRVHGD